MTQFEFGIFMPVAGRLLFVLRVWELAMKHIFGLHPPINHAAHSHTHTQSYSKNTHARTSILVTTLFDIMT